MADPVQLLDEINGGAAIDRVHRAGVDADGLKADRAEGENLLAGRRLGGLGHDKVDEVLLCLGRGFIFRVGTVICIGRHVNDDLGIAVGFHIPLSDGIHELGTFFRCYRKNDLYALSVCIPLAIRQKKFYTDGYRGESVVGLYQRQITATSKIVAGNGIGRRHRIRGSLALLQKGDHTSLFSVR